MKVNSLKIKKEFERAGYSNTTEFAKAFGVSRPTIDILLKKKTTTLKTLNRLAEFFDVDAKDLLI
jgi:transcriptional regulator with XRE-family HTH domain